MESEKGIDNRAVFHREVITNASIYWKLAQAQVDQPRDENPGQKRGERAENLQPGEIAQIPENQGQGGNEEHEQDCAVAVGTALTSSPPHRSVRAELPHTAPTSDVWRKIEHSDKGEEF